MHEVCQTHAKHFTTMKFHSTGKSEFLDKTHTVVELTKKYQLKCSMKIFLKLKTVQNSHLMQFIILFHTKT